MGGLFLLPRGANYQGGPLVAAPIAATILLAEGEPLVRLSVPGGKNVQFARELLVAAAINDPC